VMENFFLQKDISKVNFLGHQLKSTAMTIGADELVFYGRYFEHLVRFEKKAVPYAHRMLNEFSRCLDCVDLYLKGI
jgi:hypothetical protein